MNVALQLHGRLHELRLLVKLLLLALVLRLLLLAKR